MAEKNKTLLYERHENDRIYHDQYRALYHKQQHLEEVFRSGQEQYHVLKNKYVNVLNKHKVQTGHFINLKNEFEVNQEANTKKTTNYLNNFNELHQKHEEFEIKSQVKKKTKELLLKKNQILT